MYYKWSDEGHIRSTTIQFHIDYETPKEIFSSNTIELSNQQSFCQRKDKKGTSKEFCLESSGNEF